MKTKLKTAVVVVTLSLGLAGCAPKQATKPSTPKDTVTYTLKADHKTFAKATFKVKQHSTVLTGLKQKWTVKASKGFITSIDKHAQNTKASQYWTYTINKKFAKKGANQQKLKNHDQIVFDLSVQK
jgi:type IV pilus biogenesis protein CpaD/CtpE